MSRLNPALLTIADSIAAATTIVPRFIRLLPPRVHRVQRG